MPMHVMNWPDTFQTLPKSVLDTCASGQGTLHTQSLRKPSQHHSQMLWQSLGRKQIKSRSHHRITKACPNLLWTLGLLTGKSQAWSAWLFMPGDAGARVRCGKEPWCIPLMLPKSRDVALETSEKPRVMTGHCSIDAMICSYSGILVLSPCTIRRSSPKMLSSDMSTALRWKLKCSIQMIGVYSVNQQVEKSAKETTQQKSKPQKAQQEIRLYKKQKMIANEVHTQKQKNCRKKKEENRKVICFAFRALFAFLLLVSYVLRFLHVLAELVLDLLFPISFFSFSLQFVQMAFHPKRLSQDHLMNWSGLARHRKCPSRPEDLVWGSLEELKNFRGKACKPSVCCRNLTNKLFWLAIYVLYRPDTEKIWHRDDIIRAGRFREVLATKFRANQTKAWPRHWQAIKSETWRHSYDRLLF